MHGVDLNWMEHFSEFLRGDAHEHRQAVRSAMACQDYFHADRDRYGGDHRPDAFLRRAIPVHGLLTYRESLRDIETCLSVHASKLYHMGFRQPVRRSTLADANERRDWRIHAALAQRLITQARTLYVDEELGLDLTNTVYALDSTTIALCLSFRGRTSAPPRRR